MRFHTHTFGVVLMLASLAFLLLSMITVPVLPNLYLSSDGQYKYGIFGYCQLGDDGQCSDALLEYYPSKMASESSDWKMSSASRDELALMLMLSPVSGGLTFIAIVLCFMGHFRACGRSRIFWVFAILATTLAFFSSALICIVVILLFYPHVTWITWLLVPAAALNMIAVGLVGYAYKSNPKYYRRSRSTDLASLISDKEIDFKTPNLRSGRGFIGGFMSDTGTSLKSFSDGKLDSYNDDDASSSRKFNDGVATTYYNPTLNLSNSVLDKENSSYTKNQSSGDSATVNDTATNTTTAYLVATDTPELRLPNITNPYESEKDFSITTKSSLRNSFHSVRRKADPHEGYQTALEFPIESASIDPADANAGYSPDSRLETQEPLNPTNQNRNSGNSGASGASGASGVHSSSTASGFTSVSQREINPKYYKGALQRASLPGQYPPSPQTFSPGYPPGHPGQFPYTSQYYPGPMGPGGSGGPGGHPMYGGGPMYGNGPMNGVPAYGKAKASRTDVLLNNNPDFALGGGGGGSGGAGAGKRPGYRRFAKGAAHNGSGIHTDNIPQHVANGGYKNRPKPNFPAASLSKDSPYGRL